MGITLIIATHDLDLVPLFANKICILKKGQVVLQGSPAEIFSQADLIRGMDLRLPRITHLFEILSKENNVITNERYPLTIGEARKTIVGLLEEKDCAREIHT